MSTARCNTRRWHRTSRSRNPSVRRCVFAIRIRLESAARTENTIALLRGYFRRELTSASSPEHLLEVENELNTRPWKLLGDRSLSALFDTLLTLNDRSMLRRSLEFTLAEVAPSWVGVNKCEHYARGRCSRRLQPNGEGGGRRVSSSLLTPTFDLRRL